MGEFEKIQYREYLSHHIDIVQLNVIKYLTGWVLKKLPHNDCKSNMRLAVQDNDDDDIDHIILQRLQKDPELVIPNLFAFELGVNMVQYFNSTYHDIVRVNRDQVKARISQCITYQDEFSLFICEECFDVFKCKIMNSLINGQIKIVNDKSPAKKRPLRKLKTLNAIK